MPLVKYTIQVKPDAVPVVNPPRRLPVSLRNIVKIELDAMVDKEIIAPVTEPTLWVASICNGSVTVESETLQDTAPYPAVEISQS